MERTERFYKIQNLLRSRQYVRTQEFMDALGFRARRSSAISSTCATACTRRSSTTATSEAYRLDRSAQDSVVWQLPGLWFSSEELHALLTMDRLLGDLQPGVLSELIGPLRKRLRDLLQSGEHDADEIARRIRILRWVAPSRARPLSRAVHRVAVTATPADHAPRRATDELLEREVSPQRLVHYRDNWYLDAWCHKRQACGQFGVDAIEIGHRQDKAAKDVADDTLERHFRERLRHLCGQRQTQRRQCLHLQRATGALGLREIWHPRQEGRPAARWLVPAEGAVCARAGARHGRHEVRCRRRSARAAFAARGRGDAAARRGGVYSSG
jgi:predicted DNA-binding transcriptional regulator YafY